MSKSKFAGLAAQLAAEPKTQASKAIRAEVEDDKAPIYGRFSKSVRTAIKTMAIEEDSSVQALLGEAIDLLMRERGRHPFGER